MSTTPDLEAIFKPLELTSPVTGKTYKPPLVGYRLGMELRVFQEQVNETIRIAQQNIQAAKEAEENGEEPPEKIPAPDYEWGDDEGPTPENMLGEALIDEMEANGEPHDLVMLATDTVWQDFLYGRAYAEEFWASGGDTKKATEKMTARNSKEIPSISTNTGEANTTKTRASTSGTTSQKKPSKKSTTTTKNTGSSRTKSRSATKKS
jgi:hypothetical protein